MPFYARFMSFLFEIRADEKSEMISEIKFWSCPNWGNLPNESEMNGICNCGPIRLQIQSFQLAHPYWLDLIRQLNYS